MAKWSIYAYAVPPRDGSSIQLDVARVTRDGVDVSAEIEALTISIDAGKLPVLELRLVPDELRVHLTDPALAVELDRGEWDEDEIVSGRGSDE